ncbi:unnamed protein product [Nyctereutes procyonoides]|uniref:(raccoon dog) hypothetical protein n=1 Tax=Nyctereutes procyonoides TaxID=34880 RepID=A0A811Y3S4_NYCPR|nr:unnamed protein product [Nyctereutes procyonoides]
MVAVGYLMAGASATAWNCCVVLLLTAAICFKVDRHFHLRVFVEVVLPNGHVAGTQEVTLICPKPGHAWTLDSCLAPYPLHPTPGHSFVHSAPALLSLGPGPTTQSHPGSTPVGHPGTQGVDKLPYAGRHPMQDQCQVASRHIPCRVRRGSKEACQQADCCYDNSRGQSGHFVLAVSQETALAHGITLLGSFVFFHFLLIHCGTTVQVAGNQLVLENQLVSDLDGEQRTGHAVGLGVKGAQNHAQKLSHKHPPQGPWKKRRLLHLCCIFNASGLLLLQVSIFPRPPPAPVSPSGPCGSSSNHQGPWFPEDPQEIPVKSRLLRDQNSWDLWGALQLGLLLQPLRLLLLRSGDLVHDVLLGACKCQGCVLPGDTQP